MYQSKQGQPLTQTRINEPQQEPELHPHDSCARVAPEDRLKHSQPQTRDKENDIMSNLTGYVRNIEEKEPVKGLRGSGVRVALEDSIRRYANEPERETEKRAAPRPESDQGQDVMSHLTGFIQNIDENEPVKGLYGSGVRVHDEDRWKYRAQPEGADIGSMSTNITGSNINLDENEPSEEVRRAGRTAPGENPPHQPGTNPVMQTLTGFIRNVDEGEPIKGIYGAGVRADEEDKWQTFAEPTQEEEEIVRRAGRASTAPLTRNVDDNDMWRSAGKRVTQFEPTFGGYMSRQYFQEWIREKTEEPIKGPEGNCARIDPHDRLRHSLTTPTGCNWAV